jgi:hypothetical protein
MTDNNKEKSKRSEKSLQARKAIILAAAFGSIFALAGFWLAAILGEGAHPNLFPIPGGILGLLIGASIGLFSAYPSHVSRIFKAISKIPGRVFGKISKKARLIIAACFLLLIAGYSWIMLAETRSVQHFRLQLILGKSDFGKIDLGGADLRGVNLRWADLHGANLSEAVLVWADLRWADLRGTDLRGTDLGRTAMGGHYPPEKNFLEGAIYDEDTIWPPGMSPDRYGAVFIPSE